ncbi:MAG TPA: hypothetical protein VJB41_03000 [Patescibacteria group bacterium]|nr:hypothetical protein [Patescibacteria group bacterium]
MRSASRKKGSASAYLPARYASSPCVVHSVAVWHGGVVASSARPEPASKRTVATAKVARKFFISNLHLPPSLNEGVKNVKDH